MTSIAFGAAASVPGGLGPSTCVVAPFFTGPEAGSGALAEVDPEFCRSQGFEGKAGQALAMPGPGGAVAVAVGLGDRGRAGAEEVRRAAAAFVRAAWGCASVVLSGGWAGEVGLDPARFAQVVAEGASLAAYRFDSYRTKPGPPLRIESVTLVGGELGELSKGASRGARVAEAVSLARDLVNEPAGSMTPARLAETAASRAGAGLSVSVMDEAQIDEAGLGGLVGVSRGSSQPPRLVKLRYEPASGSSPPATVALVGKGITFDSGGLSLKSSEGMMAMKTDMSGAAAVVAAMSALGDLGCASRVLGFVPVTENMPGGRAIKPGDVLRIRNGKTIEVLNTDAEGRLVLADALALAAEERPDAIVDLATLTGACVVALGKRIAGLMGNDDRLIARVSAAAELAGEPAWVLPLPEEYRKQIDSEIADMKNIGSPGEAGTLAAGLLLKEFVDEVPWAHLDIAGPARSDSDEGYLRKGATGFGVRTVLELLSGFGEP